MNNLVGDLEFMHTQLDDLLYLIYDSFEDHIDKLEIILKYLKSTGLNTIYQNQYFTQIKLSI